MLEKRPAEVAAIVRKCAAGEWADFSHRADADGRPGVEVDAAWIRRLLTERWPFDGELGRRSSREPQAVRIRGLRIRGILDLSECRGPEGRGCRPLLLESCTITGDPEAQGYEDLSARYEPALKARHARWARLELKDCRIPHLDLRNTELLGDLRIEGLRGLHPEGQCWVEAIELEVRGSIVVRRAQLRLAPAREKSDVPEFALHLGGARVQVDVQLRDGFVADGGVCLTSSRIGNDLWIFEATLKGLGEDGTALTCQESRVEGGVGMFSPAEARTTRPFQAEGPVKLLGMSVNGSFNLSGAKLQELNAVFLEVGENLVLLASGEEAFEARTVKLDSCRVKGNCWIDGAVGELIAHGSHFEAALSVSGVQGTVNLTGSEIGGRLAVKGAVTEAGATFWAGSIQVAGDASLQGALGEKIHLWGGRFGDDLYVNSEGGDLEGRSLEVAGNTILSGRYPSRLHLASGRFQGDLSLTPRLGPDRDGQAGPKVPQGPQGGVVNLEGARVAGELNLDDLRFDHPDWTELAENAQVRTRFVSFYPDWRLGECLARFSDSSDVLLFSFLYAEKPRSKEDARIIVLDGTSPPIHELNAAGELDLKDEEARKNYLRFFCAHVWGEEGPFTLVERREDLPQEELEEDTSIFPVRPLRIEGDDRDDSWPFEAVVWYGEHLFRAVFRLFENGMLEMEDDEPLQELKPGIQVHYERPVRRVSRNLAGDGWPLPAPLQAPDEGWAWRRGEAGEVRMFRHWLRERFAARKEIRLQKCKVGALNRLGVIRGGPEVLLNGFEYQWIDPSERMQGQTAGGGNPRQQFAMTVPSRAVEWLESLLQGKTSNAGRLATLGKSYSAQPYEQLAGELRRQGHVARAREITLARLRRERREIMPGWLTPLLYLFDWTFGYALKTRRALVTFVLLILLGTGAVVLDKYGSIHFWHQFRAPEDTALVVKVVGTTEITAGGAVRRSGEPRPLDSATGPRSMLTMPVGLEAEVPCGDLITAPLYALDVFVPFLDLHQETRCTISTREDALPWRWLFFVYRILGWLVTTLLVLTVTKAVLWHVESRL